MKRALLGFVLFSLPAPTATLVGAARVESPFESEIRAFESADASNPPPPGGYLFVGSSSIRLWTTLAEDFPKLPVIGRGFGGSRIADSTRYADRIIFPYKPAKILLYAGDNDLADGRPPEKVREDFQTFVAQVRTSLPGAKIYFIAIKPSLARWALIDKIREANRLIREMAGKDDKVEYVDIFTPMLGPDGRPRAELLGPDGLHLNRARYELWRDVIAPVLK